MKFVIRLIPTLTLLSFAAGCASTGQTPNPDSSVPTDSAAPPVDQAKPAPDAGSTDASHAPITKLFDDLQTPVFDVTEDNRLLYLASGATDGGYKIMSQLLATPLPAPIQVGPDVDVASSAVQVAKKVVLLRTNINTTTNTGSMRLWESGAELTTSPITNTINDILATNTDSSKIIFGGSPSTSGETGLLMICNKTAINNCTTTLREGIYPTTFNFPVLDGDETCRPAITFAGTRILVVSCEATWPAGTVRTYDQDGASPLVIGSEYPADPASLLVSADDLYVTFNDMETPLWTYVAPTDGSWANAVFIGEGIQVLGFAKIAADTFIVYVDADGALLKLKMAQPLDPANAVKLISSVALASLSPDGQKIIYSTNYNNTNSAGNLRYMPVANNTLDQGWTALCKQGTTEASTCDANPANWSDSYTTDSSLALFANYGSGGAIAGKSYAFSGGVTMDLGINPWNFFRTTDSYILYIDNYLTSNKVADFYSMNAATGAKLLIQDTVPYSNEYILGLTPDRTKVFFTVTKAGSAGIYFANTR